MTTHFPTIKCDCCDRQVNVVMKAWYKGKQIRVCSDCWLEGRTPDTPKEDQPSST